MSEGREGNREEGRREGGGREQKGEERERKSLSKGLERESWAPGKH